MWPDRSGLLSLLSFYRGPQICHLPTNAPEWASFPCLSPPRGWISEIKMHLTQKYTATKTNQHMKKKKSRKFLTGQRPVVPTAKYVNKWNVHSPNSIKANWHTSRRRFLLFRMFNKRFKSLAGSKEQRGRANPVARRSAPDLLGMTLANTITSIWGRLSLPEQSELRKRAIDPMVYISTKLQFRIVVGNTVVKLIKEKRAFFFSAILCAPGLAFHFRPLLVCKSQNPSKSISHGCSAHHESQVASD